MTIYFNYRVTGGPAESERRPFLSRWRRLAARDKRWVHPHMPTLRWALDPGQNEYLRRMDPYLAYAEAVQRQHNPNAPPGSQPGLTSMPWEVPVAAAAALSDPRHPDRASYLALLQCENDEESLDQLMTHLGESMPGGRHRRLIGPTGLSPHLESGLLVDSWDQEPPWHTAYNPPFLSELVAARGEPMECLRLYRLPVPEEPLLAPAGLAAITPFDPQRLAGDLLPLMVEACLSTGSFVAPDEQEVRFILRWLGRETLSGRLASVEQQPVGFVLMQPDRSRNLRRAGGANNMFQRLHWRWLANRPNREGRLLFGAVDPAWRAKGLGQQLLQAALIAAQGQGWRALIIGPVVEAGLAAVFLANRGARPQQTYQLFEFTI